MSYHDQLVQYDEAWYNAPVEDGNFDDLPDGRYQCFVDRAEIEQAKTSGRLQLKWEFLIGHGEHENRRIWKYSGLESPENFRFLKTELSRIGVEVPLISQLEDHLKDLLDAVVEVQLKTKTKGDQKYQNVYVNKRLNEKPGEPQDGQTDDDLPF